MSIRQKFKGLIANKETDFSIDYLAKNYTSSKVLSQFADFEPAYSENPVIQKIIKPLIRDGIVFVKDFYSPEEVDAIASELIPEIDKLDKYRDNALTDQLIWIDDSKTKMVKREYGYTRLLKVEQYGNNTEKHVNNKFFQQVASEYYGRECNQYQAIVQKSINAKDDVGLDWHYDHTMPRFKVFLYLHEVSLEHGPLSLYKGTQHLSHYKLKKMRDMLCGDAGCSSIVSPEDIQRYIEPYYERVDGVAKKGTVVFADANAIHRGLMTQPGFERYSVVVYFSPDK
jgi:ribosomal protein L17